MYVRFILDEERINVNITQPPYIKDNDFGLAGVIVAK